MILMLLTELRRRTVLKEGRKEERTEGKGEKKEGRLAIRSRNNGMENSKVNC